MAGLAGLSPLAGWVNSAAFATAEQRNGGPAHPEHARGQWAEPERMPWALQAWALSEPAPVPDASYLEPFGTGSLPRQVATDGTPLFDATPYRTHAAPWPKGVETSVHPDAVARQLEQSAAIHAIGFGASQRVQLVVDAQQDSWHEDWNPGPESATLQMPVNRQVAISTAGGGSTDRVGNPRGVNDYDFQNAHLHRRYATGSLPGNYMWMKPSGRPMVKSVPGPARPAIGEASPFTGQDLTRAWSPQGAVLQQAAADYEAPASPYTAPPLSQQQHAEPGPVKLW